MNDIAFSNSDATESKKRRKKELKKRRKKDRHRERKKNTDEEGENGECWGRGKGRRKSVGGNSKKIGKRWSSWTIGRRWSKKRESISSTGFLKVTIKLTIQLQRDIPLPSFALHLFSFICVSFLPLFSPDFP